MLLASLSLRGILYLFYPWWLVEPAETNSSGGCFSPFTFKKAISVHGDHSKPPSRVGLLLISMFLNPASLLSLTPSPVLLTGSLRQVLFYWVSQLLKRGSRSITSFGSPSKKSSFIHKTQKQWAFSCCIHSGGPLNAISKMTYYATVDVRGVGGCENTEVRARITQEKEDWTTIRPRSTRSFSADVSFPLPQYAAPSPPLHQTLAFLCLLALLWILMCLQDGL